jgi:hypothetical protein
MAEGDLDPIAYATLGNRIRALQEPWRLRISAATTRKGWEWGKKLRKRSPCGRLVDVVRRVSHPDDGGNLLSVGMILRDWNSVYGFNYGGTAHDSFNDPKAIIKTTSAILIEAQRGKGRYHADALLRYLWEHKRWRPDRDEWPRLLKGIGPAARPFFDAATGYPFSEVEIAPLPPGYVARDVRNAVTRLFEYDTSTFVGRENLIDSVDRFVEQRRRGENSGLLVITALAGHGKSSLAREWCRRHATDTSLTVVPLLCSLNEVATRAPDRGVEYLNAEIARLVFAAEPGTARPISELTGRLEEVPSRKRQLILWIDGIDECDAQFERFLPNELADSICVIISARASPAEIPLCLMPFLSGQVFTTYKPTRLNIGAFNEKEIRSIIACSLPGATEDSVIKAAANIHSASEGGIPILVSEAVRHWLWLDPDSKEIDMAYGNFNDFARRELSLFQSRSEWDRYAELFFLVLASYETMTVRDINSIIGKSFLKTASIVPSIFMRWLYFAKCQENSQLDSIGFTHPVFKRIFVEALSPELVEAHKNIAAFLMNSSCSMAEYRASYLPRHLANGGMVDEAVELTNSPNFFSERVRLLGSREAISVTTDDIYQIARSETRDLYRFGGGFRADIFAEAMRRCEDHARREELELIFAWYF